MYADIRNNNVRLISSLPFRIYREDGQSLTSISSLPLDELRALGFYPVEEVRPDYDSETQRLGNPEVVLEGDHVVATYPVVDKTPEELAAELEAAKITKLAELAAARFEQEIGGVSFSMGGESVTIRTDRESQSMITGAALQASIDSSYRCRWKTVQGFVSVGAEQIMAVASAVRAHVQASFDREAELVTLVEAAETVGDVGAITWGASTKE